MFFQLFLHVINPAHIYRSYDFSTALGQCHCSPLVKSHHEIISAKRKVSVYQSRPTKMSTAKVCSRCRQLYHTHKTGQLDPAAASPFTPCTDRTSTSRLNASSHSSSNNSAFSIGCAMEAAILDLFLFRSSPRHTSTTCGTKLKAISATRVQIFHPRCFLTLVHMSEQTMPLLALGLSSRVGPHTLWYLPTGKTWQMPDYSPPFALGTRKKGRRTLSTAPMDMQPK